MRLAPLALILLTASANAAPPKIDIPAEVKPSGDYATVQPTTDAVSVTYVGLSGVDPFPSGFLKDSRSFVLPVRGLKAGQYQFAAIAASKGGEQSRRDFVVIVGSLPGPTPVPPPPKPPEPQLDPASAPDDGLYVLLVYESGEPLTPGQVAVLYGQETREWLKKNAADFRAYDADTKPTVNPWKEAVARDRKGLPWVIVAKNRRYVHEGPLPDSPEAFVKLVTKHASDK